MSKNRNSDVVKARCPIQDVRSPYFCVWLEEMARKGMVFKSKDILFGTYFTKAEPHERRYRPIYKSKYNMSEDEIALYEDSGWNLVKVSNKLTVATTADAEAPEVFNDDESFRDSIKGKWKSQLVSTVVVVVLAFGMLRSWLLTAVGGAYTEYVGYLHAVNEDPTGVLTPLMIAFAILLFTLYILLSIDSADLCKLLRRRERPEYKQDEGYRVACIRRRLIKWVSILILVCLVPIEIIGCAPTASNVKTGPEALGVNEPYPVKLSEFDSETWESVKPQIEAMNSENSISVDYSAGHERGRFLKKGYLEELTISNVIGGDEDDYETQTTLWYNSYYGEAKDADIAFQWLGEEATYDIHGKVEGYDTAKVLNEIKIDCDEVDYVGYVTTPCEDNNEYEYQYLYMQRGDTIEIIDYLGPIDLREKMSLFIDELR